MRDCQYCGGLRTNILKTLFFVVSVMLAFLFVFFPLQSTNVAHAAGSYVLLFNEEYNDETGETAQVNEFKLLGGGTYQLPPNSPYIQVTPVGVESFGGYGFLYRINSGGEREDQGRIGRFGATEWTWGEGVYEVDVYAVPPPILSQRTIFQKLSEYFFPVAYADSVGDPGDSFVETIRFTIKPSVEVTGNSNVAFFPGVQSSYLYKEGLLFEDELWLPTFPTAVNNDIQGLFMNTDGTSKNQVYTKEGDIILKAYGNTPVLSTPVYAGFKEAMDTLVQNNDISAWKAIAYDWRLDFAQLLSSGTKNGNKISYSGTTQTPYVYEELKKLAETSKNGKVTLVGHSNGGLFAKALLADLEKRNDPLLSKIDKLILVATPQLGTPKAMLSMLHGSGNPLGKYNIGLRDDTWREATRYTPAAYNLLPSKVFYTNPGTATNEPIISFAQSFDSLAGTIQKRNREGFDDPALKSVFDYRSRYGDTVDSYKEFEEFLKGTEGRPDAVYADTRHPSRLTTALIEKTKAVHATLDAWMPKDLNNDGTPDIKVVQIAGWGIGTMRGIQYETKDNVLGCKTLLGEKICTYFSDIQATPLETTMGDETVVLGSATSMPVQTYYVDLQRYNDAGIDELGVKKRIHANIMAAQPVMKLLTNLFKDESVSSMPYVSTSKPSPEDLTIVEMHSPVELEVTDTKGGRLGWKRDPTTGVEYLEETIPNATYLKIGESTFITLPTENAYKVKLDGYATGTFTLKVKKQKKDVISNVTSFSNLPSTQALLGEIALSPTTTPSTLLLDTNGDGSIDKVAQPDKTISGLFAEFEIAVNATKADKITKKALIVLNDAAEKLAVAKKIILAKVAVAATELVVKEKTGKGITKAEATGLLDILKQLQALLK